MIWYALAGVFFGTIGGMGMGGGVILIPVLTVFLGEAQHSAQALNLAAFLPMSAFALFCHIKKKRVALKVALLMAACGTVGAVLGALAANFLDPSLLKKCFGGFLILIGILRIVRKKR